MAEDGEKGIAGAVALLRIPYGRFLQRLVYRFIEAQDIQRRRFRRHRHLCHPQTQYAGPHRAKFRRQLRQRESNLLAQGTMRGGCRFLARYFRYARGRFLFPLRRVLDDIHVAHDGFQHLLSMIAQFRFRYGGSRNGERPGEEFPLFQDRLQMAAYKAR